MGLKGRLDRLEKSAKASPQDTHDPVAEEVCRLLSDQELRLIAGVLRRELDGRNSPRRRPTSLRKRRRPLIGSMNSMRR